MTSQALRMLAVDVVEGKVFGTWMLPDRERDMVPSIFVLLMFAGPGTFAEDTEHVYEYYDRAGPVSINGYPMFFSCHGLRRRDCEPLWAEIDRYRAIRDGYRRGVATTEVDP